MKKTNKSKISNQQKSEKSNFEEKIKNNNDDEETEILEPEEEEEEQEETEETEEKREEETEPKPRKKKGLKTKRLPDLDEDDTLVRAVVSLPKKSYKKLGQEAFDKEVSKATILREALKEHFEKEEQPSTGNPLNPNSEPKYTDEEITTLLNSCFNYWGGFETMGDKGFFNVFEQNDIKLEELTEDQFISVCKALKIGYDGFISKPSIEEFLGNVKELDATEDQITFLGLVLEHGITRTIREPLKDEKVQTLQDLIEKVKTQVEQEKSLFPELM